MKDRLERSPRLYLSEIVSYIEIIESITKGLTYETFMKDVRNVYSVDDLGKELRSQPINRYLAISSTASL